MYTFKLFLLCSFLLGFWQPNASASEKLERTEEIFHCGLYNGCMADFRAIQALIKNTVPVLKKVSTALPSPTGTSPLRHKIINIQERIDNCNRDVMSNCKIDLSRAKQVVLSKVKFLTNSEQQPDFMWGETNKKLYIDTLLRKLCSGAASMAALESLDGIFFGILHVLDELI